jgi:hypothetical protein
MNPLENTSGRSPSLVTRTLFAGALGLGIASQEAGATCGSAFCMVNTSWNVQGAWTEPGLRFDLRYEFIDQDQPMAGSNKVGVGQIPKHHDEIRTINRNWLATLDYAYDENWGASATLPVLDRDHSHIHNHMGQQLLETWKFTRVGDLRVLGRRQWRSESREALRLDFYGVNFGLKLPTGDTEVRNADGDLAERTLQPGTGTTDVLIGGYFRRMLGSGSSWFTDALVQQPLNSHRNFKPGTRVSLDLGYRYEASDKLALMLQLNALHKDHDQGSDAEPQDSGGRFLFVSPGLSYMLTKNLQLYGFVQLPLYQYLNGVQLTADWAVVAGVSTRF